MKPEYQERIEAYLTGQMTDQESKKLEADLQNNPELAEACNLLKLEQQTLKLLHQQSLREQMNSWKEEKAQEEETEAKIVRPNFRRSRFYQLSVAASVALVLGLSFAFWQGSQFSDTALAEEGFLSTNRSDRSNIPPDSPLVPILDQLNQGATSDALSNLQAIKESPYRENAFLLEGEIYYQQGEWDLALQSFQTVVTKGQNISNIQKAEWNYAHTLIAADRIEEARRRLGVISTNEGHAYADRARGQLEKLDSFWRVFSF
jgi:tetratricopeptide (TPR) repeat protein